jgi:hypothetical protein
MSTERWISPAWLQIALQALRDTLDVDAQLKREMIQFLYDEGFWDRDKLKWEAGIARFNACLNPEKPDKFSLAEVWALSKRFDRDQLVMAMLEDMGYERPRRRATEERHQAALERVAAAIEQSNVLVSGAMQELRIQGMEGRALRLLPTFVAGGVGNFSLPEREESGRPSGMNF